MKYVSTRDDSAERVSFCEVVLRGTAPDGGLYVHERIPSLDRDLLEGLASLSYEDAAARVISAFDPGLPADLLDRMMRIAYPGRFHGEDPAPLVVGERGCCHRLELWHGPTAAFKDLALQVLPLFMEAASGEREHLVLVATSGDTGSAALEGFADRPGVRCAVFYPAHGVSELQRLQMTTRQAENIAVFSVEGDFDDCQRGVKALMADPVLASRLLDGHGLELASANSINWGRILPQIVYYAVSWSRLHERVALPLEGTLDVSVPTGNFGNLLAAWYARSMGVPLGRLVCATNSNDVLAEFLATGRYDLTGRELVHTPSPSMDILRASNLERHLYHLTGGDAAQVGTWMQELDRQGSFEVDPGVLEKLREVFLPASTDDAATLEMIRRCHEEKGVLLDPHTAAAWAAAEHVQGPDPMLVVSTAHWSKFPGAVARALEGIPFGGEPPPSLSVPQPLDLHREVATRTTSTIPPAIRGTSGKV